LVGLLALSVSAFAGFDGYYVVQKVKGGSRGSTSEGTPCVEGSEARFGGWSWAGVQDRPFWWMVLQNGDQVRSVKHVYTDEFFFETTVGSSALVRLHGRTASKTVEVVRGRMTTRKLRGLARR